MDEREFASSVCYMDYDDYPLDTANQRLCSECRAMILAFERCISQSEKQGVQDPPFYERRGPFDDSIIFGCPLCFIAGNCKIFHEVSAPLLEFMTDPETYPVFIEYRRQSWGSSGQGQTLELLLRFKDIDFERYPPPAPFLIKFALLPAEEILNTSKGCLGNSTSSEQAVNIAQQWMDKCASRHIDCHLLSNFLPTRLLDVSSGPESNLRLVRGNELPSETRYLTLSHCWGSSIPKRLLRDNIVELRRGLSLDELPRTFQDAINFTRLLGQQYLWIDSLCIIQDDEDDWQRESAQMSSVYGASMCNLSATSARDSSMGMFRTRDPMMNQLVEISLRGLDSHIRYALWDMGTWETQIERSPLNARAWVCQERLLSPCNLHFTDEQLFWECAEFSACEIFPEGSLAIENPSTEFVKAKVSHITHALPRDLFRPKEEMVVWSLLVEKYSRGKLTFDRDKLVAISGLAASRAQSRNDMYLAGLWKSMLMEELLWYTYWPEPQQIAQSEYVSPTWSWASLNAIIQTMSPTRNALLEERKEPGGARGQFMSSLVHVQTDLVSQSAPYGQVKGGRLQLMGPIALANLQPPARLIFHASRTSAIDVDICVFWDRKMDALPRRINCESINGVSESLYLMPILRLSGGEIETLILRATGGNPYEFTRLGVLCGLGRDMSFQLLEACRYYTTLPEAKVWPHEEIQDGEILYSATLI